MTQNSSVRGKSVLIFLLNYNNNYETEPCLKSLSECSYKNFTTLILDNGSSVQNKESLNRFVKDNYPDVLIESVNPNIGFAGGVNFGLKYGLENNFDYILLLNNDVEVKSDFIERMLDADTSDSVGLIGCKQIYYGTDIVQGAGGEVNYFKNVGHMNHYGAKDSDVLTGIEECVFVSGTCMLVKKQVIENIGYFDESFFIYLEDTDYSFRATQKGWKNYVSLDSVIWHKEGATTGSYLSTYFASRNKLKFIFKHSKGFSVILRLFVHMLSRPIMYLKWKNLNMIKADLHGLIDYIKGKRDGNTLT